MPRLWHLKLQLFLSTLKFEFFQYLKAHKLRLIYSCIIYCIIWLYFIHHEGFEYFCSEECSVCPLGPHDPLFIKHIREKWLKPPSVSGEINSDSSQHPEWAEIVDWKRAQDYIIKFFTEIDKKPNLHGNSGSFVEVGAQDGEFMSLTSWLEKRMGWSGLLIEPNPTHYKKLLQNNRNSYSINACASIDGSHKKDYLWVNDQRSFKSNLMEKLNQGTSRLKIFANEEAEGGHLIPVQCFNLDTMVVATFNQRSVDLIVINTKGGEIDILKHMKTHAKMIVLSNISHEDRTVLQEQAKLRDMVVGFVKGTFKILVSSGYPIVSYTYL